MIFRAVILEGITGTGLLSLPKIHKYLSKWNKRVKYRTPANEREKGQIFIPEDLDIDPLDMDHFNTRWESFNSQAGDMHFMHGLLPFIHKGPCESNVSVLFSCLMRIKDNGFDLEYPAYGTVWDVTSALRKQTSVVRCETFLESLGEDVYTGKFPPSLELTGLGAISDALVGRRDWEDPEVVGEVERLLGDNWQASELAVQDWIMKACERAVWTLRESFKRELYLYGKNSYVHQHMQSFDLGGGFVIDIVDKF